MALLPAPGALLGTFYQLIHFYPLSHLAKWLLLLQFTDGKTEACLQMGKLKTVFLFCFVLL